MTNKPAELNPSEMDRIVGATPDVEWILADDEITGARANDGGEITKHADGWKVTGADGAVLTVGADLDAALAMLQSSIVAPQGNPSTVARPAAAEVEGDAYNRMIEQATQAGLDAACLVIQQALGVQTGDFAGMYWSGPQGDEFADMLRAYANDEIKQLPEAAPVAPAPANALRAVLGIEWVRRIEVLDPNDDPVAESAMLNWPADSHCGEEVLRIVARAEEVMDEWADAASEVRTAAIHQMLVVCYG